LVQDALGLLFSGGGWWGSLGGGFDACASFWRLAVCWAATLVRFPGACSALFLAVWQAARPWPLLTVGRSARCAGCAMRCRVCVLDVSPVFCRAAGGLGLVVCFVAGLLRLPSVGAGGLAGEPGSFWPACLVRGRFCPPAEGRGRRVAGAVRPWQSSSTVRAMVSACQRSAGFGAGKLGAALLGFSK
jgi:hypothetical protein